MKQETQPLVLFSWGYWGWGSTARQFVESVDLVEKARGFNPPIFIDARLRRSVRAPGFRDSAFQQLVGEQRYRWMNGLGNKGLDTGIPELNDLTAIPQLLKFADECALQRRRLIYYCACETPGACHRYMVTEELVKLAKKDERKVSVVEWPGTDLPEQPLRWNVSKEVLIAIERGRKNFTLPGEVSLTEAAGIGWCTPLLLSAGDDQFPILIGPAHVHQERWVVPVFDLLEGDQSSRHWFRRALKLRTELGYAFRGDPPELSN